jgi:hypothetical protein
MIDQASEPVNCSGAPEWHAQVCTIKAPSTGIARAMASIGNAERAQRGMTSGGGRNFHRLSGGWTGRGDDAHDLLGSDRGIQSL